MNASELSREMARDAAAIAQYLLPNGKRDGKEWRAGSIDGDTGKSLGVRISGDRAGIWSDFATGESGDLLDLWCAARNCDLPTAMQDAKQFLGIRDDAPRFTAAKREYKKPVQPKCTKPKSEVLEYLTKVRCLEVRTIEAFKIGESGHHMIFPYLWNGEARMIKQDSVRRDANGKRIEPPRPTSAEQEPCLFGWQALPGNCRRVIICEGEIDACSWWQVGQPALSVPFGGGKGAKHQWLETEFDKLDRFDEILLAFDNDPTGQEAIADLVSRIGTHRVRIIDGLKLKDANEALQAGVLTFETAKALVDEAKHQDPEELRQAVDFTDSVVEMFHAKGEEPGFFAPWEKTTHLFKFRPAEVSVINGVNGHGKSELVGHIALGGMDQGERFCVASMELQPKRLLHRLMRQALAVQRDLPSPDYIRQGMEWTREKLWIFDVTGTAKAKRILEVFEYAHRRYGIKAFIVDSLMKCGIAEDDYNGQKAFVEALCDFKNRFSVHIFLVTHSRKGDSEEKPTGKMDVKGTGAITDLVDNVFIIWRNKPKERERQRLEDGRFDDGEDAQEAFDKLKEKPDAVLSCHKQRNGEWEGGVGLWFCPYTKQYLNSSTARPHPYVSHGTEARGVA